jgi:tetratricopeptide (TPR) repeat protein
MKRFAWILLAFVTAASLMVAQVGVASQAAPAPQAPPLPQTAPGAPPNPTPPQPAPPRVRPQPQAKTEEEYKAYQEAMAKDKPEEVEAAANQFAAKFPDSELRTLIYRRAMTMYQEADNADKVVEMGRKILAIDPDNPVALVMVAAVLSERTRENDPKRDQLLAEAAHDAQRALQTIDTNLPVPPDTSPERAEEYKNMLRAMAYEALGMVDFSQNQFALAEPNLRKATEIKVPDPDPYNFLRLAIVLDRQNKYQEAMSAADRALQLSPPNSQPARYAQQERDRLAKLVGAPPQAGTPSPAATPQAH